MISPAATTLVLLLALVLASAAAGVWFGGLRFGSLSLVPLGGGVLAGMAAFWVMPEIVDRLGWFSGAGLLAGGALLLGLVDRYIYPVCPTCSHTHDHDGCPTRLHGFAGPLIAAAALHSFFDGVAIAAAQNSESGGLGRAVIWGVALHKAPEGLALGVMFRAAVRSWSGAFAACIVAQLPMLLGGLFETLLEPALDGAWTIAPVGLAGGSFLFLGLHAVHTEWKRRGAVPAFLAACSGAAIAAVLQHAFGGSRF